MNQREIDLVERRTGMSSDASTTGCGETTGREKSSATVDVVQVDSGSDTSSNNMLTSSFFKN